MSAPSYGGTAWRIALVVAAMSLAAAVAFSTREDAHPDEYAHLDAFRYFESHLWPPDVGSDEVVYSVYGWSRVYTGEVVYWVFGQVGRVVRLAASRGEPMSFAFYRVLDVGLLGLTLSAFLFTRCDWCDLKSLGVALACIPQVLYVHGYANSEAWGIAAGSLLFVRAAVLADRDPSLWRLRDLAGIGLLTGCVVGGKAPFLAAIVLPSIAIGARLASGAFARVPRRRLAAGLGAGLLAAMIVAAPLKVVYPISEGNFAERVERLREEKARDDYKPSRTTEPGYRMSSRGATAGELLLETRWLQKSLASFYGAYGYLSVWNPLWVYLLAGALALVLALRSAAAAARDLRGLDTRLRAVLLASPLVFLASLAASLWSSLHVDYQPQGRYLFGALVPLALVVTGAGAPARPRRDESGRRSRSLSSRFPLRACSSASPSTTPCRDGSRYRPAISSSTCRIARSATARATTALPSKS